MTEKHASMSEVTAYLFMYLFLLQGNILTETYITWNKENERNIHSIFVFFPHSSHVIRFIIM